MNVGLLYNAARAVATSGEKPMYFAIDMTITSPGGKVEAKFVNHLSYECEYIGGFTPAIRVRLGCLVKEFREVVWAHRNNLAVVIKTYPVNPTTSQPAYIKPPRTMTFRGLLIDNADPSLSRGSAITSGVYTDGSDDMLVFYMQLVDKSGFDASFVSVGGTYPMAADNGKLITAMITQFAKKLKAFDFLTLHPIDEKREHDVTVIPHDIKLVKLPHYIQQHEGGLYNHGCAGFIFNRHWWIYPPYNLRRYSTAMAQKTEAVLDLYQVPTQQVPGTESTWFLTAQSLRILCNGPGTMQDISVGKQLNDGNGVRYLRASRFMNAAAVNRGDNTGEINREVIMAEMQTSKRADGITSAQFSANRITDNDANELSKLAAREGMIFLTSWQNSVAMEYIHPGHPVRVYQDKGGHVSVRDGIVIKVKEEWLPAGQGMMNKALTRACGLTIFLDRNDVKGGTL